MTFYVCKNNHSFTNLKICPSCFCKSKFRFCKTCLHLVGVWENHDCQNKIERVIEVEKIPIQYKTENLFIFQEIKKVFGKNCKYYKIDFLKEPFFIVECGLKFYNVYSDGIGIQKVEQIVYHNVPFEQWSKNHDEFHFEMSGSNLFEFLKNRNSMFCYQVLRQVEITSLFEFVIGYPMFTSLKQDAEKLIQSNIHFVEYDSQFNYNMCKFLGLFLFCKPKKGSLLHSRKKKHESEDLKTFGSEMSDGYIESEDEEL